MQQPGGADHRGRMQAALDAIEHLQARLDHVERAASEPIAIIGIGCRFPGGIDDAASCWAALRDGRDMVAPVPAERWDVAAHYDPDPEARGKIVTREAGCLTGVDMFDPLFFGLSPKEAAAMDPQQRIALEVAKEAFDDAGIPDRALAGSATGVFLGLTESEYAWHQHADLASADSYTSTGLYGGIAANRISYVYDLKGPSFTVDSICSSSLLAVHLAIESMRRGECDLALAGGVCVLTGPDQMIWLSKLRTVSPGGRCRAFAADADGIVLGEGCGLVVLKPLKRALVDRDRIYALVRGSGVSQDGRSNGLTAPSRAGQEAMLRNAYARARVAPGAVHYVDAHGTGTALGDPIEAAALGAVLGAQRPPGEPCFIGSAKTNLSHLGPAGGIASLIKTTLAVHHRALPPSLHFTKPNPHIPFDALNLRVADRLMPWPYPGEPAVAGVNSLAFGGTNVHVVLSEAERAGEDVPRVQADDVLLPLSAASAEALRELAQGFADDLARRDDIRALATTAARRRSHHAFRMALVGRDGAGLAAGARAGAEGRRSESLHAGMTPLAGAPRIAFVFSGHGAQYPGMGRRLLATSAVFRQSLEESDAAIRGAVGWSVLDVLASNDAARLRRMDVVQPVLFAVQVALATFWQSLGIVPAAVIGSSVGEIAAAHVAGHLTLGDAVCIVCARSRLLEGLSGRGAMGFVELPVDAALRAIRPYGDRLAIAVVNGPRSCVLSGDPDALDRVFAALGQADVFCQRVNVTIASHSPHMDALRAPLRALLGAVAPRDGEIAFCSTVEADFVDGAALDAEYWIRNLREPVRFGDGIARLAADGCELFLEISPHPLVLPAIAEVLRESGRRGVALPSLHREEPEWTTALNTLAGLYVRGCDPAWEALYPDAPPAPLPRYPWQRQRLWLDPPAAAASEREAPSGHPLLGTRHASAAHPDEIVWDLRLDPARTPWLAEHRLDGRAILPAAAAIDLALAAVRTIGPALRQLADVRFMRPIEIDADAAEAQLVLERTAATSFAFAIHSRTRGTGEAWQACVQGRIDGVEEMATGHGIHDAEPTGTNLDPATHYERLAQLGGEYGPLFRRLVEIRAGEGAVSGRVEPDPGAVARAERHAIDPILLDAAMQAALALLPADEAAVPAALERFNLLTPAAGGRLVAQARLRARRDADAASIIDIDVSAESGELVALLEGLTFLPLRRPDGAALLPCHAVRWERLAAPVEPPSAKAGRWLIFADGIGMAQALADEMRRMGHRCEAIADVDPERIRSGLDGRLDHDDRPLRVVYGTSLDSVTVERDCRALLAIVQSLIADGSAEPPQLVVLTRGAQVVTETDGVDPSAAALWGLGRSIALEHPRLRCRMLDVAASADAGSVPGLLPWLMSENAEYQVALRDGAAFGQRLVPAALPSPTPSPAAGRALRLELAERGRIEALRFTPAGPQQAGPGEVAIRVRAAGLNFMDVLRALGALRFDDETAALRFGMECVGEVTGIGDGVQGLAVGDRVLAVAPAPGCIASDVVVPRDLVADAPDLPDAAAAGLPIAYMTALHALDDVARLGAGERVLIHAAAGGVGLAAVAVAQSLGAVVYATAGSEAKRDYLRTLGVSYVYDSRTLAFADEIRRDTGGRGVDVVLNSLAGEAMRRSVALLAPFGRFVEIGKRDQQEGTHLALSDFARSLSYASVDLARILRERPDIGRRLLAATVEAVHEGRYPALPHLAFPLAQADAAFRTLARAEHVGKVVLAVDDVDTLPLWPDEQQPALRADATYLVTGGAGGIGLPLAAWLVEQGARHVVLTGRRELDANAREAIAAIAAKGACITHRVADVADTEAMQALFAELASDPQPLRGIFHLAAAGDDALIADLTWPRFANALRPKVDGALNLDRLSAGLALDHFVLFSSTAAVLGAAGQANYAAANAFLDALAASRRARGLPGLSIAWGPWQSIGGAAARDVLDRFRQRGLAPLAPARAFATLRRLLSATPPAITVAEIDADRWAEFHPEPARSLLAGRAAKPAGAGDLAGSLRALGADDRRAAMVEHLRQQVAAVLGMPAARIDPQAVSIADLGLDSLMSLELRTRLEGSLGLKLSATLIWNHPTFEALGLYLLGRLGLAAGAPTPPATVPTAPDAPAPLDVEALSEAEAEAMLLERLDAIGAIE